MRRVSIIIPVYNGWNLTNVCLESLAKYTKDIKVYVVDNASSDETQIACPTVGRTLFGDRFTYTAFDTNRNFGPACNAGAEATQTDYLLFLNNDTEFSSDWLPPLVTALDADSNIAAIGPILVYPDETIQHLGVTITPDGSSIDHLYKNLSADHPLTKKYRKFQSITAACILLQRKDFFDVGGFYHEYINGFEDIDLCLTLTSNGRYMTCHPESTVIHKEEQNPERKKSDTHNSILLRSRHDFSLLGDMDTLLQHDDYTMEMTPYLDLCITLPQQREHELLTYLEHPFNPQQCFALLKQEPFWRHGTYLLTHWLKKHGEYAMALDILSQYVQICNAPSIEDLQLIIDLSQRLHKDTSGTQKLLNNIYETIYDETLFTKKRQYLTHIFTKTERYELLEQSKHADIQAQTIRATSNIHTLSRY